MNLSPRASDAGARNSRRCGRSSAPCCRTPAPRRATALETFVSPIPLNGTALYAAEATTTIDSYG